ncbi:caskin-2-like [Papaver somniferum]|uniref:caskin-2-like n=1 Tax=Papaver somniferum TaxID=3469 RepID=UPI000E6FDC9C|nr:caskin-2-like [Papaver somniferum]
MESRREAILSADTNEELNQLKELLAKRDDGRGLANAARNIKDDDGVGIVHFAAREGKLDILRYLIEELGLDVNTKDKNGESPLLNATMCGDMNTVEYLLGKGADPETSNFKGYTPLHGAALKGYTDIVTKLLSRGVNVNALCENGTPLDMAVNFDQFEAAQVLLDHNANPNLTCGHSFTPLTGSIISGFLRFVEPLLEAGADPDGGSHGETPLTAAATDGLTEIIKRLIQAGANPDITNRFGLTPLEIAALYGYYDVVEILFPVTSRIPEYIDWSIGGVIAHVQSDQFKEQRELKVKEKFQEAKLSGADAFKKQDYCKAVVCYSLRYSDAEKAFLAGLELSPNSQELKDAYRKAVEAQTMAVFDSLNLSER